MSRVKPIALTIAGFDTCGGAGIIADIKVFHSIGVYGLAVITALTSQNTQKITLVKPIEPEVIESQLEVLVEDFEIQALKISLIPNLDVAYVIRNFLDKYKFENVVYDPIQVAKVGTKFIGDDEYKRLRDLLLPRVKVFTPNIPEFEKLFDVHISDVEDLKKYVKDIANTYGIDVLVVKGGHLKHLNESIDVVYVRSEDRIYEFRMPRVTQEDVHGTGCVFSAAITAYLAKGLNVVKAIEKAKKYTFNAIKYRLRLGKGYPIIHASYLAELKKCKYDVIKKLLKARKLLIKYGKLLNKYIPEVQSNLVYALPKEFVEDTRSVAAFPGRIVKFLGTVKPIGYPTFGASRHVAKYVVIAQQYNPEIRSAMNIKFDERVLKLAEKLGYLISFYDRREEPLEIKVKEGATIPWGTKVAIERIGKVPDIIYHKGDWGKEPQIIFLGKDPINVLKKILRILCEVEGVKPKI